jgi:hypothetical protein
MGHALSGPLRVSMTLEITTSYLNWYWYQKWGYQKKISKQFSHLAEKLGCLGCFTQQFEQSISMVPM